MGGGGDREEIVDPDGGSSILRNWIGASSAETVVPLLAVHVNIAVYAFGFWLTRPVEPFLLEKLGGNPKSFGLLQSWFSFLMLIGGPVVGRICDTKGAHVGLIVTQAGASLAYGLTGLSQNLAMLFLARVPTILLHTGHACQAVAARLTSEENRAVAMGRLMLSYRIGQTLGSSLGGVLALRIGYSGVALVAALASVLSMPLTHFACAPTMSRIQAANPPTPSKDAVAKKKKGGLDMGKVLELVSAPKVRNLVVTHTMISLGLGVYTKTYAVVLKESFSLDAKQLGFVMTLGGMVGLFSNLFLIGPVSKLFNGDEFGVVKGSAVLSAVSSALFALTRRGAELWRIYALLIAMDIGQHLSSTVFSSLYTKSCDKSEQGTCLALQHGVSTFLGIFLPTAGVYMYTNFGGVRAIGFSSAGLLALSAALIQVGGHSNKSGVKKND